MHEMIQSARNQVKDLYGIDPSSIEMVFEKKGLRFFEGGCTWIDENRKALIQIKPGKVFFYKKEEILAHEYVHALRAHLDEPKFEEFLAYRTSKNKFRALFGPMILSEKEVYLFFFSLLLQFFYYPLFFVPIFLIACSLLRILRRNYQFKQAKCCLEKYLETGKKAESILFLLKDKEIIQLSKGNDLLAKKLINKSLSF